MMAGENARKNVIDEGRAHDLESLERWRNRAISNANGGQLVSVN